MSPTADTWLEESAYFLLRHLHWQRHSYLQCRSRSLDTFAYFVMMCQMLPAVSGMRLIVYSLNDVL